ncbi:hypothetical protein GCM10007938_43260 [Vibrio zhanjiangensis]|uniref:Uncharacterized protein n=1 Tax=Vibrio zhanjiangensis TaxID=1046128 RepID=A0ABQ6F5M1_9VIBR|nr:hypothetical protein GCM10007938_43260 [Vibrio zhanjiangensis]
MFERLHGVVTALLNYDERDLDNVIFKLSTHVSWTMTEIENLDLVRFNRMIENIPKKSQ